VDVVGLEIAVDDAVRVGGAEGAGDVRGDEASLLRDWLDAA